MMGPGPSLNPTCYLYDLTMTSLTVTLIDNDFPTELNTLAFEVLTVHLST